jgi:AraC-like DNA-binding protein
METNDEFRVRIRREQRLTARLRLATERLEEAQRERIWAVVEAHQSGLSIRQIAAVTALSSSRVHQLLGSEESREVPRWLSQWRDREAAPLRATPTFRPTLRARWKPTAGAASGWNAWSVGRRSW